MRSRAPAGFRAKLDDNEKLATFSTDLESAVIETIEAGYYTKDLAICVHGTTKVSNHMPSTGAYSNMPNGHAT